MPAWNIQPSEVGGVLNSVAGHLGEEGGEGLVGVMENIEEHLGNCAEWSKSGIVAMALGEFAEHHFGVMGEMVGLTVSAVTQTSEATTHYVNGNTEMALEAQRSAGVVPEPEPEPAYPHGPNQPY
ncbi:DUF6507 family protein [Nocardiopsis sp. LOL_012]|uniref:DUF6507 family protein n=1 Tax=Nocardiopsis sp. LOL_012 TaxID=3345409 RepID=UPI003A8BEA29